MKKVSILGIVLVSVSAITAAFIPSNAKSSVKSVAPGQLEESSFAGQLYTCTAGAGDECDYTLTEPNLLNQVGNNGFSATFAATGTVSAGVVSVSTTH